MKASEIKIEKEGYNFNCNTYPARSHYKHIMHLGRVFPTTKAQAKYFVSQGICLDVLNADDVHTVESMMNKHGFKGEYKSTKSGTWVRLQNHHDLHEALKMEYGF